MKKSAHEALNDRHEPRVVMERIANGNGTSHVTEFPSRNRKEDETETDLNRYRVPIDVSGPDTSIRRDNGARTSFFRF